MIVDLNLQDRFVIVVGGGNEAQKRVNSLLKQGCDILVISDSINRQIKTLAKNKKIKTQKQKISNAKFLSQYKPDMVITTTNNSRLNEQIIKNAKKKRILAYSSDNPDVSDFANPAIIDFENIVQIAIFTGGKSPAMSKKLRIESEKIFKKIITKEDIAKIKIQEIARKAAKNKIASPNQRKAFLRSIIDDNEIKQLIKDRKLKKAEKTALERLDDWHD